MKGINLIIRLSLFFLVLFTNELKAQEYITPEIDSSKNSYFYTYTREDKFPLNNPPDTVITYLNIPNKGFDLALYPGNAEINELYIGDTVIYNGKYVNRYKVYDQDDNVHILLPKSNKDRKAVLKSYNISTNKFYVSPYILSALKAKADKAKVINNGELGLFLLISYIGGVFTFFIYVLGLYSQNRLNKDFLFFSIYLLITLLHTVIQADEFLKFYLFFPKKPIIYHQLMEFGYLITFSFFVFFIREFLNLKETSKFAFNVTNVCLIYFGFCSLFYLVTALYFKDFYNLQHKYYLLYIGVLILSSVFIYSLYKSISGGIKNYVVIGCILILIFSSIELYSSNIAYNNSYFWNVYSPMKEGLFPMNYGHIGVLLEIILLALAIGYKYKIKDKELVKYQKDEINKLAQKSKEREAALRLLEDNIKFQKNQLKKKDYLFQDLRTQFGTIKNQLNPQFISNILDSVSYQIDVNQNSHASNQILKFNSLVQNTLRLSEDKFIDVLKEIENIQLYLELEQLRLNNSFSFQLNIDPKIKDLDIEIPPFLHQEYLEFCLWNHIINRKENNNITINFEVLGQLLTVEIIETGKLKKDETPDRLEEILMKLETRIKSSYNYTKDETILFYEVNEKLLTNKLSILFPQIEDGGRFNEHLKKMNI